MTEGTVRCDGVERETPPPMMELDEMACMDCQKRSRADKKRTV